jgi:2'-5' RNA ligase
MEMEQAERQQRLFFALWPEPAEQRRFCDIGRRLLAGQSGKLIVPEAIHMTVVFLGNVSVKQLPQIRQIGAETPWQDVNVCFDRIGWFRRARVVWAGSSNPPETLATVVAGLQARLRGAGLDVDRRSFQPHVTLLRKIRRPPAQREMEPVECCFRRIYLVRSQLDRGGSRYVNVDCWPTLEETPDTSGGK